MDMMMKKKAILYNSGLSFSPLHFAQTLPLKDILKLFLMHFKFLHSDFFDKGRK